MARLLGPSPDSRLVYRLSGGLLCSAAGDSAVQYAAASGGTLADVRVYDGTETPGAAIPDSTLTVDAASWLPQCWWPDGVDVIYVEVAGGSRVPLYADMDRQVDALEVRVTALEPGGGGEAATAAALAAHGADSTAVHGIADTSLLETTAGAQAKASAAQAAAIAASAQRASNLSDLASAGAARTNLGLGSVDNTSDAAKPVSTATQAALDAKFDKAGGSITGHVVLADVNLRLGGASGFDAELYRVDVGALGTDASLAIGDLLTAYAGIETYGTIFLGDEAGPPATPAGGGVLYVEAGALKYKGSSGTVTTLGPA